MTDEKINELKDLLKRCPSGTFESLILYLEKRDPAALEAFIVGVLKRHIEPEYEQLLDGEHAGIRFIDDLGIDSMGMMEIVMMVEECLDIQLENRELMQIQTFSDLDTYIRGQLDLSV